MIPVYMIHPPIFHVCNKFQPSRPHNSGENHFTSFNHYHHPLLYVCWTSLKDKLLQATKQVCGVSSNHPWRKQTWWWNNQVEEAVREKRRCFKLWKAGGSRAAYNTAKRTSNRAVHQARSEAEKVALQKIDPRSGDVYRLAKQMRRDNQDVMGEKPVKNDAGQLSLDEEAKKEAWREHYERLLNVEFPWNPEDLSEESPVEGPS